VPPEWSYEKSRAIAACGMTGGTFLKGKLYGKLPRTEDDEGSEWKFKTETECGMHGYGYCQSP